MPIIKDYQAQAARAQHAREAKDRQNAKERQMLAEGNSLYSVYINSNKKNFEAFINTPMAHYEIWASDEAKAKEQALKLALIEGLIEPEIEMMWVSKGKKSK